LIQSFDIIDIEARFGYKIAIPSTPACKPGNYNAKSSEEALGEKQGAAPESTSAVPLKAHGLSGFTCKSIVAP
jgi:hypothetical protein